MRLPWVSRSVMDGLVRANDALNLAATQLISERDWLRSELHNALDHNRRLERKDAGLTERPREPKPPLTLPANITKIIDGFGGGVTREMTRSAAAHQYASLLAEGKSPDEAERAIEGVLLQGLDAG